jgi:hypothetical protein
MRTSRSLLILPCLEGAASALNEKAVKPNC